MSKAMSTRTVLVAFVVVCVGCAAPSGLQAPDAATQVHQLGWLTGVWINTTDETVSEEHWTAPADDSMLGMNRTLRDGRLVFFEYLRIEATPDGVFYLASPRGRSPATSFRLIELTHQRAVFENLEHDYPQRIIYEREGDTLRGRIEGIENGRPASSEWTWRRAR